jgi:hypothetical protein
MYGRFATAWTTSTHSLYKTDQWLVYFTRVIWLEYFNVWKSRCDRIHGDSELSQQQQLLNLQPQVEELYKQQEKTEQQDAYLFATPMVQMLQHPISTIQKWIFTSTLRLRQIRIRKKQQLKHTSIHPFFLTTKFHFPIKGKNNKVKQQNSKYTNIKPISSFFSLVPSKKKDVISYKKDDLHPP